MSAIEDAVQTSSELAGDAAELLVGPAAELAADVATIGVDAVVAGVDSAGELVEAAIDEGGSLLLKLLVVAGLVAIAVFVWKRMQAADEQASVDPKPVG